MVFTGLSERTGVRGLAQAPYLAQSVNALRSRGNPYWLPPSSANRSNISLAEPIALMTDGAESLPRLKPLLPIRTRFVRLFPLIDETSAYDQCIWHWIRHSFQRFQSTTLGRRDSLVS
jgi:hypothetical protein